MDRLVMAIVATLCVSVTGAWGFLLLWGATQLVISMR
jgi:hypothetical protein